MVVFGPKANCTLQLCPIEMSIYRYRPSFVANTVFIALYAIAAAIHTYLGFRWKQWWFTTSMLVGCVNAVIGYAGRMMLYYNPWSFSAFMIQIICITTGPVYYCAAIYITLSIFISALSPSLSRLPPTLSYWIFISCDIISLVLQAAGGGISTSTSGQGQMGVDLAIAGMAFQVVTIVSFCALIGDYLWRYFTGAQAGPVEGADDEGRQERQGKKGRKGRGFRVKGERLQRLNMFFGFMGLAILLVLGRCVYRFVELREGYSGHLIHDEGLFIGLEGVFVLLVVYCLMVGHPGWVFVCDGEASGKTSDETNFSETNTREP